MLFFAFPGYARIATLGEEVRDPEHTIPRAVTAALAITVALYLVIGIVVLAAAGPQSLAHTHAPLARVGAAAASLGAVLALIAGIGRTGLAIARNRDLPGWLAYVAGLAMFGVGVGGRALVLAHR